MLQANIIKDAVIDAKNIFRVYTIIYSPQIEEKMR
jgi:hypothetical protein